MRFQQMIQSNTIFAPFPNTFFSSPPESFDAAAKLGTLADNNNANLAISFHWSLGFSTEYQMFTDMNTNVKLY